MPSAEAVRPRVALVVSSMLSVHAFLRPHLTALAESHDITVCVPDDLPELRADIDVLPVRLHIVPLRRQISPVADLLVLLRLWVHFRREGYDIVHTISPKAGLLGTLAGFVARIPVRIHTYQGEVWATAQGARRRLFRALDRLIARLTTHQTVVSRSERAFLRAESVLGAQAGVVLADGSIGGVDSQRFAPNSETRDKQRAALGFGPDETVFLFLGRLNPDKGIGVLTAAFEQVRLVRPGARLLLVGPDEGALPPPDPALRHLPYTRTPEEILPAADCLVLPSFREGFGVVVLEAAALGLPAIGSDIYGIQDAILDGETGFLVPVRDPGALAERMQALIDDPALRTRLGAAARRRALEQFSQERVVAAFTTFYRELPTPKTRG